jgi:hypothetical protein
LGVLGKGITEIRDLSENEYREYKKASSCLLDFSSDQQLYTIALLNHDDFLNTIEEYTQEYAKNPQNLTFIVMERMVLNINRHLLNFLSSARSFLDHNETKLKKQFGDQSKEYERFRDACTEVYDNNFSYRFLSKLRNYTQHCGMPLGGLTLSSKEDPPYSGKICHSLQAKFSREALLKYDSWGKALAKEISKLPEGFAIAPHIIQMMKCLEKINLALIDENLPKLFKSTEFIEQLISSAQGKDGSPCILQFLNIKRGANKEVESIKVQITQIPFHIIEIVNNIKREKTSQ